MIRFIIKNTFQDNIIGISGSQLSTILLDVPSLEAALRRGGCGPSGHDSYELIGVELIDTTTGGKDG